LIRPFCIILNFLRLNYNAHGAMIPLVRLEPGHLRSLPQGVARLVTTIVYS